MYVYKCNQLTCQVLSHYRCCNVPTSPGKQELEHTDRILLHTQKQRTDNSYCKQSISLELTNIYQEKIEIFKIQNTNTVIHPGTVMVHSSHTPVTFSEERNKEK